MCSRANAPSRSEPTKGKRRLAGRVDYVALSRDLADGVESGIYIIQSKKFVYVNPFFEKLTGYSREELIGMRSFKLVLPQDRPAVKKKAIRNLKSRLGSKPYEYRFIKKNGEIRWVMERVTPIEYMGQKAALGNFMDITERKQAEEALRVSEALLQATGEMAKVGGWELDAETLEVSWTEETYRIHELPLGYKPPLEEAINYYHPEERQKLSDSIQRSLKYGEAWDMDARFITAKGNHLWVRSTCSPELVDGKTVRLRGTLQDITERKQAEVALQDAERQYRALFDRSLDCIFIHDLEGNFIDANQATLDLLGYQKEEITAINFISLLSEDLLPLAVEALEEIRHIGYRTKIDEYRLKRKDGEYIYVETRGTAIRQGKKASAVLRVARSITERKRIEEALRAREYHLSLIHDNVYDVIFVIGVEPNDHFRFISINYRFMETTGLPEDQVVGRLVQEVIPEPAHALVFGKYKEAIRNRQPAHWEETSLYPTGLKVGEVTVAPIFNANGNCTQLIGTIHDITEQKLEKDQLAEASRQLEATNEELRSTLADKDALLKEVHHRVKNNLMVVSSLLNLQMRRTTDQEAREALRESDARVMSMATIHEMVLQSGEYASIDCVSYINNLVSNIRSSLAPYNKDIRVIVDVQPGIVIGLNQAVILGMIINELASNSFKYAFPDREKGEISISCRYFEDQVQVSIKDNGVGVSEETDTDHPSSLGLQLVATLVKQLKATIKYERDNGSKFTIMFSAKPESIQEVN